MYWGCYWRHSSKRRDPNWLWWPVIPALWKAEVVLQVSGQPGKFSNLARPYQRNKPTNKKRVGDVTQTYSIPSVTHTQKGEPFLYGPVGPVSGSADGAIYSRPQGWRSVKAVERGAGGRRKEPPGPGGPLGGPAGASTPCRASLFSDGWSALWC